MAVRRIHLNGGMDRAETTSALLTSFAIVGAITAMEIAVDAVKFGGRCLFTSILGVAGRLDAPRFAE